MTLEKLNLKELDSQLLLSQIELVMAKIAMDTRYVELHQVASEGVEIAKEMKERVSRTLGGVAVK